jgi:peptide chain release factor subunit 3
MDDPSVNWSETRWNEICDNLTPFLNKSGFQDRDIFFVPVSGLTGENILEPVGSKCTWYTGPTLFKILDKLPVKKRDANGTLRIVILDKMKDKGVFAFGKIESGTVKVGDKITILPSGYSA